MKPLEFIRFINEHNLTPEEGARAARAANGQWTIENGEWRLSKTER